jgi:uncharacterized protein YqgC (DUF456 family)
MSVTGLDLLQTVVLFVMVLGIAGALLPSIPGAAIVWLAALVYDLIRGFTLRSMTVLTLVASTSDLWLSGAGARRGGASGCAVALAVVAGIIGLIFFNIVGAILLPVITVLVVELVRLRDVGRALQAGGGYLVGWLLSTGVELLAVLVMIALWLWQINGWRAITG